MALQLFKLSNVDKTNGRQSEHKEEKLGQHNKLNILVDGMVDCDQRCPQQGILAPYQGQLKHERAAKCKGLVSNVDNWWKKWF